MNVLGQYYHLNQYRSTEIFWRKEIQSYAAIFSQLPITKDKTSKKLKILGQKNRTEEKKALYFSKHIFDTTKARIFYEKMIFSIFNEVHLLYYV